MITRRHLLQRGAQLSLVAATRSLLGPTGRRAFAQVVNPGYKATVVIAMNGGNDANNMLIPLDRSAFAEYRSIRGVLALSDSDCIPLQASAGQATYGLHPRLPGLAGLYNRGKLLFAANVGPIRQLASKQELLANPNLAPSLFSHPTAVAEWESSSTAANPTTGWGGRVADTLASQSGSLPPILSAGLQSLFTVGQDVQAIAMQGGQAFSVLPPELNNTVLRIAQADASSSNLLLAQAAKLRVAALQQQTLIDQASSYRPIQTAFPSSGFGYTLKKIAGIMAGRSVIGASRQIFYVQQGDYDSHSNQIPQQGDNFNDLDTGLTAFYAALEELGLANQVLVCTHSDFNRTLTPNTNAGSDHGWGTHQIVLGGGITGGRILGQMPTLELNGPDDLNGSGSWIPTTSVTQLTAGVGSWMGLNTSQLHSVFPELTKFPAGQLSFA